MTEFYPENDHSTSHSKGVVEEMNNNEGSMIVRERERERERDGKGNI